MRTVRRLLADRISSGAIVALVAYLMALQGLLGAVTQGVMAASTADPLHALCAPAATAGESQGHGAPVKKAPDCPCAALCRLAAAMPAILADRPEVAAGAAFGIVEHARPTSLILAAPLRGRIGEPRAPPVSV